MMLPQIGRSYGADETNAIYLYKQIAPMELNEKHMMLLQIGRSYGANETNAMYFYKQIAPMELNENT
jgi:hypothetical protein